MFKTSILGEPKGYREYAPAEDYDLFLRIADKYPIANLNQFLVKYRIHPFNISSLKEQDKLTAEWQISKDIYVKLALPQNDNTLNAHFYLVNNQYQKVVLMITFTC